MGHPSGLIDAADEALEVAGFGEREDFRVVGRGGASFEKLHAATGVSRSGGHDAGEICERDVVRAGAGDECAAGREQMQRTKIELLVAAEGGGSGALGFGEGRRVENDCVEFL